MAQVTKDLPRTPQRRGGGSLAWAVMRSLTRKRLGVVVLVASLSAPLPSIAGAATPWHWSASGTLGPHVTCSHAGTRLAHKSCSYRIPDAPSASRRETGVITVHNLGSRRACYGVSVSSTYMAGLRRLCVGSASTGRLRLVGIARHYRSTHLSIFVTVLATNQPIHPITSASRSWFAIVFTQP